MTPTKRQAQLYDAVSNIDSGYISQALETKDRFSGALIRRAAAVAAMVAVLITVSFLAKTPDTPSEAIPFFAVRAYAADGTMSTLNSQGDATSIASGTDALFPGKATYTLDISLGDYTGNKRDFQEGTFDFRHRNTMLEPGEHDEYLKIEWLDTDDFYGYRITGWCEEGDFIGISIRDESGRIIHEKSMWVTYDNGYRVEIHSSYTYQDGLPTDALIDQLFSQDYTALALASSPTAAYSSLLHGHGGFAELETREDAPSLLLERYIKIMYGECLYEYSNDLVGLVLSRDVYWEKLTQEQKEIFASFGAWRNLDSPDQDKTIFDTVFPGKEIFEYEVLFDGKNQDGYTIDIHYNSHLVSSSDEHILIFNVISASWAEEPVFGWKINGWFDEPTVLSITVTDKNGNVVRQEAVCISYEDGYQYEVLTPQE